jgi:hypothetical protein
VDGDGPHILCWGRALTGAKHAMPKARHAPDRRSRTARTLRAPFALSAARQRAFRMVYPGRVPELGGAVIDTETSAWQLMIRAAQTPAFRVAVIAGLAFAWFGAATPPLLTHSSAPHPAHSSAPHPARKPTPVGPATTGSKPAGGIYLTPPLAMTTVENPRGPGPDSMPKIHDEATRGDPGPDAATNPELDAALNELDHQAERDEAWASQHPVPPPDPGSAPQPGPVPAGGANGR